MQPDFSTVTTENLFIYLMLITKELENRVMSLEDYLYS